MRQRKFKRRFRDRLRNLFAGALLCSSILMETDSFAKGTSASLRLTGGAYDKGKTPFVGIGLSGKADLGRIKLKADIDSMFSDFNTAKLDSAQLMITFPINQYFAFSPFAYRSYYWGGIPFAAGMAFHIPKYNLHVAPHWVYGKNALPTPISWTPSIGERVNIMLKMIVNIAHPLNPKPAPLLGGEAKINVKVVEGLSAYAKTFLMSTRDDEGKMLLGAASVQGGVEFGFPRK
jgi:hypothetical protein